ncbi:glycosyltransferase family 87 protein [Nitrobacter sp. JJSN]|uniref:glycosyltransferase family 87 protein n=1 Tax=Nitrobacter sp. JJSN TaxID=3453033 RepID=UPI003F761C72
MLVLRWPSFRRPLDVLFLAACILLTADVLVPEIWGHGKTKDYPLWFWAGQQILHGGDLYPKGSNEGFAFLYPPLSAILLAVPSYFGKIPLYLGLCLLNAAAWWMTAQLSNAMTASGRSPDPWLEALPGIVTVAFVFDMFDLGQPNLVLLVMMLLGFWWLWQGRGWISGSMFALATAIKVFPVAVLPYLLWRRQWTSAISMVAFLGIFLFLVPAPIRGFERNVSELTTWYRGMVGSNSEQGFGQRDAQNWSWVNQSIIAVTHRLVRPVNYNQIDPAKPAQYMNIADLDYKTANVIVLAVFAAIGLGFIAIIPARAKMTPRTIAEEVGILFCLMTIASPLARQYYFVWLFFPLTVLFQRAAFDPRPKARAMSGAALGLSFALMALSLPFFPKIFQAIGNNLAATFVLIAALAWHIRHPLPASDPHSVGSPAKI